jgi:murein tripeptide amidase MpaA
VLYRVVMQITGEVDGGAIEIVDAADARAIRLAIRPDSSAEFRQWFCFRVDDAAGEPLAFALENAASATYADAFDGYRVCASYDPEGDRWFRVPTTWDGEQLRFEHTPDEPSVTYAYFAPFSYARHEALLARVDAARGAEVVTIGETVQGRPMHLVVIGAPPHDADDDGSEWDEKTTPDAAMSEDDAADDDESEASGGDTEIPPSMASRRLKVWLIARQHPGETMAEWLAEGFVGRLLDLDDPTVRAARERATFYVVPNMNPDGGVLGNLRTNAAGANLNREWLEPSTATSPEVHAVRAVMEDVGVDLFLDVHGDERNPWCFLAGCEGNPSYSERLRFLENLFEQTLCAANADFQDEYGYPRDEPGGGDLSTAANWVGERFDCLAYTLEMPFKDNANDPDPWVGWSPGRSKELGAALVDAVTVCLDSLRAHLDLPPLVDQGEGGEEEEEDTHA